jgi:hypothetical protein
MTTPSKRPNRDGSRSGSTAERRETVRRAALLLDSLDLCVQHLVDSAGLLRASLPELLNRAAGCPEVTRLRRIVQRSESAMAEGGPYLPRHEREREMALRLLGHALALYNLREQERSPLSEEDAEWPGDLPRRKAE